MSVQNYSPEDVMTLEAMMSTGALVMGASNDPDLYEGYARVCQQLGRPQVIVAPNPGTHTVRIRVEAHSMQPAITREQRDRVYAALQPFGDVVSLSIPAPDNLVSFNVDWGVNAVPQDQATDLVAVLLDILNVLPQQQTAD